MTFIDHDVIKPFPWEDSLDYVIHAAGIASPFYYRAYPLETLEVSISGTKNMLELATRHQARMVFFPRARFTVIPTLNMPTAEAIAATFPVMVPGPVMTKANGSAKHYVRFIIINTAPIPAPFAPSTYMVPA